MRSRGGAVEEGESLREDAQRELCEETGIDIASLEGPITQREFNLQLNNGEEVLAEEQFFVARLGNNLITYDLWTELEKEVMVEHRWWSADELTVTSEVVYPENLGDLLKSIG